MNEKKHLMNKQTYINKIKNIILNTLTRKTSLPTTLTNSSTTNGRVHCKTDTRSSTRTEGHRACERIFVKEIREKEKRMLKCINMYIIYSNMRDREQMTWQCRAMWLGLFLLVDGAIFTHFIFANTRLQFTENLQTLLFHQNYL